MLRIISKSTSAPAAFNGRPIFIIGTGRSGTTLLYEILANHPELAWISNYTNRWPRRLELAWLSNLTNYKMRGMQLGNRQYMPRPVEGYGVWEEYFPGFSIPSGPLKTKDVTETARKQLRGVVASHMRWQRKPRFLGKWTGWSRIGFMGTIFPEAQFIHVLRDGRPVASSLLSVSWWDGWEGPEKWRWGPLPRDLQAVWENSERSSLVLAGLQWKLLTNEILGAARELPEHRYLQVKYEEMVGDPQGTFARILTFCGLPASERLDGVRSSVDINNRNEKWRLVLPDEEQRILSQALESDLSRLGYKI